MKTLSLAALAMLALAVAGCDGSHASPVAPSPQPARIGFSAVPTAVLRSGSSVRITAQVRDEAGTNVVGTQVHFVTSAGALSAELVTTDGTGYATVTLTSDEAATLTALTSSAQASMEIPALDPFTLTIAADPNARLSSGAAVSISVSPASGVVSPPAPAAIFVTCPGQPDAQLPGQFGTTIARCSLPRAGEHLVTVRAAAANGWALTRTASITGTPGTIGISATQLQRGYGDADWSFTMAPVAGADFYQWSYSDGGSQRTNNTGVRHNFRQSGPATIEVTAHNAAGDVLALGRIDITVSFLTNRG